MLKESKCIVIFQQRKLLIMKETNYQGGNHQERSIGSTGRNKLNFIGEKTTPLGKRRVKSTGVKPKEETKYH